MANEIVQGIVDSLGSSVKEGLEQKLGVDPAQSEQVLPGLASQVLETVGQSDKADLMSFASQAMANKDSLMDMDNPMIQKLMQASTSFLQSKFNFDSAMSQNVIQMILPMVMGHLQEKYSSNPLGLLAMLGGENSSVSSLVGTLGGFFGGNK